MNVTDSKLLTGDPVLDDPGFNPKHWTLNTLRTKPPWPVGANPSDAVERIALLLTRCRGKWVTDKHIETICYGEPEDVLPNSCLQEINVCRRRYGMCIDEQISPQVGKYRWNGGYSGLIDDRNMTEEMGIEEKRLLQLLVELQAKMTTLLPALNRLKAQRRSLLARKRSYHKRVRRLRAKFWRMNPDEVPYYERTCEQASHQYGVDEWPRFLSARR